MSERGPNLRVVVIGLPRAQRQIRRLLRLRREAERDAQRVLRDLRRLELRIRVRERRTP